MHKKLFIIIFTTIAIILNFCGAVFASILAYPLYLDSVFTIAVCALCGWLPGLICAICSNSLLSIYGLTLFPFTLCHVTTSIIASIIFYIERKRKVKDIFSTNALSIDSFMIIGFLVSFSNTAIGSSISNWLFGSITDNASVDNAVQGIYIITHNLTFATLLGGTLTNLADKMISSIVSFLVYLVVSRKFRIHSHLNKNTHINW